MTDVPQIERDTFRWVSQEQVATPPDRAHLLHYPGYWWVANHQGEVLLWRGRDGYDVPQANRSQDLAGRFAVRFAFMGAVDVIRIEHAFLPDDPGRY